MTGTTLAKRKARATIGARIAGGRDAWKAAMDAGGKRTREVENGAFSEAERA
jgi:hypothetical protein